MSSNQIEAYFTDNSMSFAIIVVLVALGLFYVIRKIILRRNNPKRKSVKTVRKGNSLTDEDAAFIQSCILLKKGED
ncbi:hypothetical protein EGH82_17850 [Vibrio ponticus]|uniref:Uncharacterized protein n=1 Tax=Vibrio ponticus TaxID=265668 RepID=A0A3N3DVW9_9VIBR|nr:hypothetical protein EGH82_17850 [Vibrio ponticus]